MEQSNYNDKFFYNEEKYLIDKETGKKYARSRFDIVPETRDFKKMKPNEVKNEHLQGGFFQLITEFGTNLIKRFDVSFEDLGKLALLFTYAGYRNEEGEEMYIRYGNNKYYADNKKLQEILKLNAEQVKQFKKRVKEKGILNQNDKGMYFTDDVIIRGHLFPIERKSMNYIRVYDEPIRDLYNLIVIEGKTKSSKGVGVLLALMPFMQKNKNVLSSVYFDEAEQRYRPMSNTKIAEALGIDRHVLSRNITAMNNQLIKKIGEPLIYDVTVKPFGIKDERYKKSGLVINPKYSYSSTTSDYERLISEIEKMVITLPEIKM